MEALHYEGVGLEQSLEDGHQEALGNGLHRAHVLPLSDFVHEVHVIDALVAVTVALVDGVHTDIARTTVRTGFSALANGLIGKLYSLT